MKEAPESNSRENVPQGSPAGRLKDGRAHNNVSPTIHIQDSTAEDEGVTNGKNFAQIIIPETKESNAFDLESNSVVKVSQS